MQNGGSSGPSAMMYLIMAVPSEFKDACAGCQYSIERPILSWCYLLSILPLIARLTVPKHTLPSFLFFSFLFFLFFFFFFKKKNVIIIMSINSRTDHEKLHSKPCRGNKTGNSIAGKTF
jgi:hypothetical protein